MKPKTRSFALDKKNNYINLVFQIKRYSTKTANEINNLVQIG